MKYFKVEILLLIFGCGVFAFYNSIAAALVCGICIATQYVSRFFQFKDRYDERLKEIESKISDLYISVGMRR